MAQIKLTIAMCAMSLLVYCSGVHAQADAASAASQASSAATTSTTSTTATTATTATIATTALAASVASSAASAPTSTASASWNPPSDLAIYIVLSIVLFGSLRTMYVIVYSKSDKWSLDDAISEEVLLPVSKKVTTKDANGVEINTEDFVYDKDNKPVLIPVMKASSSRLVALMGMFAILFMFIGFGIFALYGFGKTGTIPKALENATSFLATGMTLFAPYVVNKFASLFQGLTGTK